MFNVQLVTNSGNGVPKDLSVNSASSWKDMLDVNWDGNFDDFRVTVRHPDGSSFVLDEDSVNENVVNNSRVTIVPRKVEGERA